MSKRPPNSSVRSEFNRLEAASTPWWAQSFAVMSRCVDLAILPFRVFVLAAEAVVAVTFAALIVTGYLWYTKVIPDTVVVDVLTSVGTRLLAIVEASGLI